MNVDEFDAGELRQLLRESGRIARGPAANLDKATRADGRDVSGAVRATVDGHGRVVEFGIDPSWRNVLRPAELGKAVVQAVDAAERQWMAAWMCAGPQPAGDAADDSGDGATWADALDCACEAGRSRSLGRQAIAESTRELYYLAMDAVDQLAEAGRAVEQATAAAVRRHSTDRYVSLAVSGGRVVGVDFDQSWLKRATAAQINRRLRAAFHAVDQAGPRATAAKALDHPSIRELQEISADPRELLRRLGLSQRTEP
jgi:hypothetical protein